MWTPGMFIPSPCLLYVCSSTVSICSQPVSLRIFTHTHCWVLHVWAQHIHCQFYLYFFTEWFSVNSKHEFTPKPYASFILDHYVWLFWTIHFPTVLMQVAEWFWDYLQFPNSVQGNSNNLLPCVTTATLLELLLAKPFWPACKSCFVGLWASCRAISLKLSLSVYWRDLA